MEHKIVIVAGPTASGKSAWALALAQEKNGRIINADALQLYVDMRILTARPSAEDEAQAPHALYGVLSAREASSAGKWLSLAKEAIETSWLQGHVPIVVGGTGLYLKTLMRGIAEIPPVPDMIRAQVREWAEEAQTGGVPLHDRLHACDTATAARLAPGDTQRLSRALEVWHATGRSLLSWQQTPMMPPFPQAVFEMHRMEIARDELYRRCNMRFEQMLETGAVEEVERLRAQTLPHHLPILRAVGVPEISRYLDGEWSYETMLEKAKQATRHYAKRQLTWLRYQLPSA